jgi:hypothetical protein
MTPERWQEVKCIFDAASERDPSERNAFLDAACQTDAELRSEVDSLRPRTKRPEAATTRRSSRKLPAPIP